SNLYALQLPEAAVQRGVADRYRDCGSQHNHRVDSDGHGETTRRCDTEVDGRVEPKCTVDLHDAGTGNWCSWDDSGNSARLGILLFCRLTAADQAAARRLLFESDLFAVSRSSERHPYGSGDHPDHELHINDIPVVECSAVRPG